MKIHANARTTIKTRALLVDQVICHYKAKAEIARAFGTNPVTVAKWVGRYLREGPEGLRDRSSAPHHIPHRTPEHRARRIAKLRHRSLCAWQIAQRLRMAPMQNETADLSFSSLEAHPQPFKPGRAGATRRQASAA